MPHRCALLVSALMPTRLDIVCKPLSLRELRRLPPIASGFSTDRVFCLERRGQGTTCWWRLHETELSTPFHKQYDRGSPDEWLASYLDTARLEDLHFVAAWIGQQVVGILTWQYLAWNNTVWLIDVRVTEAARRTGAGSALMNDLRGIARQRRARGITVETQINNYAAICFYLKHGFQIAGFDDHLYTNHDLADQDVAIFLFWEEK